MKIEQPETAEDLNALLRGYRMTDVICAGVELGVFDALAKQPATAAQAARKLHCNPRGTETLLNALAAVGLLRKRSETFSLLPVARKYLVSDSKQSIANMVRHTTNLRRSWIELPESVRTGRPVPKSPETMKKPRKQSHREFIMAMHDSARRAADGLAAAIDLTGVDNVLDVGGGPGSFLFAMVRRKPSLRGVILDLPETIAVAHDVIMREGYRHAIGTMAGDFHIEGFGAGFDLVLMSSIIHINSPARNLKLIKKGYGALRPGGRLIVRDFFLDDTKTRPAEAALFSLNMLVNTESGASYSETEIRSWFEATGFEKIHTVDLPPRSSLMIGARPAAGKKKPRAASKTKKEKKK